MLAININIMTKVCDESNKLQFKHTINLVIKVCDSELFDDKNPIPQVSDREFLTSKSRTQ